MIDNYNKLRKLLQELFQLDRADLDFGIYRIMNQKRDEITRFLDDGLLPQVQEAFKEYRSSDRIQIESQLNGAIEQASALGADPDTMPKVMELRAKYSASVDVGELENEVFSHLYDFFRRYYHEGDFLSLRRYKEGVYAIPYEGEEVKLHWANHDQYYIKTSEYLRDYTFKLPSGKPVHFKLIEADTEKDNTKAQNGQERRFSLCQETPLAEEDGELFIRFEYQPDPEKTSQKDLNARTIETILNTKGFNEWLAELAQLRPTEKNHGRTLLEKHLTDYTARNTFDYFIHKNLGVFLRRELDFYIKNEVMHLDDVEHESAPRVEQYLSKIKVIRKVAHKVIEFLAQIEDFQKKLWLKKKFVVETNYCVTLDRVPQELYPEIAANDSQREEWVRLFAIDDIKEDLAGTVGYSSPLTIEFLKANPYLVLDTKFFKQDFKDRLLATFDDTDNQTDGLLIHSENFHALSMLKDKYNKSARCIYIDPPYNTGTDEFLYKDVYQHSSWIEMLSDRLVIALYLMSDEGAIWISIDDNEVHRLRLCSETVFGTHNFVANVIWHKKYTRSNDARWFSDNHDHLIVFARNKAMFSPNLLPRNEEQLKAYTNPDNHPKGSWKATPLHAKSGSSGAFTYVFKNGIKWSPPPGTYPRYSAETLARLDENNEIWFGSDGKSTPSHKTFLSDAKEGVTPITIWDYNEVGHTHEAINELKSLFPENPYANPKPTRLIRRVLELSCPKEKGFVIDFFAGSGTTAHAVINLNNEDDGNRKYILVEMGEYFDTVMKPRVQKVIYSKNWKDGKPVSRNTGISHMFKYIRLESYEDTLNNLELKKTQTQQALLDESEAFRESYMLSYMLDVESKDSASLLNIDSFEDPFNYRLKIAAGSAGETKPVTVDLVETFNYLIGLTVHHIDHIRGFRVVQGTNPKGEKVLIIWRNLKEKSNEDLDEFFRKQEYNPRDLEFDLIYVNGDNNVENLRRDDETWKVRLIEEEFKRLMFDIQDV